MDFGKKKVEVAYEPKKVLVADLRELVKQRGFESRQEGFVRVHLQLEGIGLSALQVPPGSKQNPPRAGDLPRVKLELDLPKGVVLHKVEYSFVKPSGSGSVTFDKPGRAGKAACFALLDAQSDPRQVKLEAGEREVSLQVKLSLLR